jgi:hypothetical protein
VTQSILAEVSQHSSEVSVNFYQTIKFHIPEDNIFDNNQCENLNLTHVAYFSANISYDAKIRHHSLCAFSDMNVVPEA